MSCYKSRFCILYFQIMMADIIYSFSKTEFKKINNFYDNCLTIRYKKKHEVSNTKIFFPLTETKKLRSRFILAQSMKPFLSVIMCSCRRTFFRDVKCTISFDYIFSITSTWIRSVVIFYEYPKICVRRICKLWAILNSNLVIFTILVGMFEKLFRFSVFYHDLP